MHDEVGSKPSESRCGKKPGDYPPQNLPPPPTEKANTSQALSNSELERFGLSSVRGGTSIRNQVTPGNATVQPSKTTAAMYRTLADIRRSDQFTVAVTTAMAANCQIEWTSVHPSRSTHVGRALAPANGWTTATSPVPIPSTKNVFIAVTPVRRVVDGPPPDLPSTLCERRGPA